MLNVPADSPEHLHTFGRRLANLLWQSFWRCNPLGHSWPTLSSKKTIFHLADFLQIHLQCPQEAHLKATALAIEKGQTKHQQSHVMSFHVFSCLFMSFQAFDILYKMHWLDTRYSELKLFANTSCHRVHVHLKRLFSRKCFFGGGSRT